VRLARKKERLVNSKGRLVNSWETSVDDERVPNMDEIAPDDELCLEIGHDHDHDHRRADGAHKRTSSRAQQLAVGRRMSE